ncbi:MAG: hypothetical protein ACRYG7_13145 [Janthinobacterium lividum]
MSQQAKTATLSLGGEGSEWAVGMPAYWLSQVTGDSQLLARFYFVQASAKATTPASYDQRLIVRVGGTESAARAVVGFVLRYAQSMGHRYTAASIKTVQERLVQAWELAGRPGAL